MKNYSTVVFISTIEDDPRVRCIRSETTGGKTVMVFESTKGRPVFIALPDEFFSDEVAKSHLEDLGLFDLVPVLFPPENLVPQHNAKKEAS